MPDYHAWTHTPGGTDPIPMSIPWAWIRSFTTPQTVPGGGSAFLSFEKFATNAPEVWSTDDGFSFGNNTAGDNFLACVKTGLVVVQVDLTWENDPGNPYEHEVQVSFLNRIAGSGLTSDSMGWDDRETFGEATISTSKIAFGVFDSLSEAFVGGIKFLAINGAHADGSFDDHDVRTLNVFAYLLPTPSVASSSVY